mmetsp:Transcript_17552/g.22972  ORF Transcript_17552/g.22972 Transcript_17552/m.22972 type:complete len:354 (-) Transcript_17552:1182-2243(-)
MSKMMSVQSGSGLKLVEFPCGRFTFSEKADGTYDVRPLPDKGIFRLYKIGEEELKYVWSANQDTTMTETAVVPAGSSFSKVNTGKETDRVYIINQNDVKFRKFFWMQLPEKSKDSVYAEYLSNCLKDPRNATTPMSDVGESDGSPMDQNSLMRQLIASFAQGDNPESSGTGTQHERQRDSGENLSAGYDTQSGDGTSRNPSAMDMILQSTPGAKAVEEMRRLWAHGLRDALEREQVRPHLAEIVNKEDVLPILADTSVQEELIQLLPEGLRTQQELYHTVSSPQFRQALMALSSALLSDNFNSVMTNFNLDLDPSITGLLNHGEGIRAFLRAIQLAVDKNRSDEASGKSKESD